MNKEIDNIINNCVEYLYDKISMKDAQDLFKIIQEERGLIQLHFTYGMYIRNQLREGNICLHPIILDDIWIPVVTEIVNRKLNIKAEKELRS